MSRSTILNLYDGTDFLQKFEIKNEKDQVTMSAANQAFFHSQGFNIIKTDALGNTIENVVDVVGTINKNTSDISQEVIDRTNAVGTVQSNLDTEVTARTDADNTLQANIDAEATTRANVDTALQEGLITEVNARIDANVVIHGRIDTEISDRNAGDINLQNQITALQSQVTAGVDWKAPVNSVAELQAVYATDPKGSVRLVKDQKDAFVKVTAGEGEDLTSLGLTGEAANSYVRFMDSVEIASGIANEASARIAGDATLQTNIDVEKSRIDAILSGADVNLDTFAEVVSYVNSLDVTQLNLITTLQNDLAQLRADHDALRAEWDAFAPGPRGGPP